MIGGKLPAPLLTALLLGVCLSTAVMSVPVVDIPRRLANGGANIGKYVAGSSSGSTNKAVYKGPHGKLEAKFDDKAAEETFKKMAGSGLSSKLGMKGLLPKVREYSKKGWHYQLPNITKFTEQYTKLHPDLKEDPKDANAKKKGYNASESVSDSQKRFSNKKITKDAAAYTSVFNNVGDLANKLHKKVSSHQRVCSAPFNLAFTAPGQGQARGKHPRETQEGVPEEPGEAQMEGQCPEEPDPVGPRGHEADGQRRVGEGRLPASIAGTDISAAAPPPRTRGGLTHPAGQVRAFDEAVADQIRTAEMNSGNKIRPGAYYKMLDTNGNGMLERGESAAVDELLASAGHPRPCAMPPPWRPPFERANLLTRQVWMLRLSTGRTTPSIKSPTSSTSAACGTQRSPTTSLMQKSTTTRSLVDLTDISNADSSE
jgi:hypothetical protein